MYVVMYVCKYKLVILTFSLSSLIEQYKNTKKPWESVCALKIKFINVCMYTCIKYCFANVNIIKKICYTYICYIYVYI